MHKGLTAFLERLKALHEAEIALSHEDIRKSLNDALDDEYPGKYCYILSVYGDDSAGDVVYQCGGDTYKCSYEIGSANGKRTTSLDTEGAINVLPRTVYDEEADEADHYASMGEAERAEQFVERFPGSAKWDPKLWKFDERFISKAERDAADSGSFAGKGKSFPILKPGDVMAAVRSMGRAGAGNHSIATLKAHIISIAKKKGWGKYLPKAWQAGGEDDSKEAVELELVGDTIPLREGAVGQDGTAYLKLIAPGWGSSGYYGSEVLKRDGAAAFPKGTKNFWNHQTAAEESARPEGDLRDLASVLTEDAHYEDNGPAGAGLYAKANVFEQFRAPVDSLAKHIGMSIRATGKAKEGKAEGKSGPIIEKLTRGISVDYVTTPGAGGKILQLFEAARRPQSTTQEGNTDMDAAEFKKLQESNARLQERLALRDARDFVTAELKTIRLHEATRARLIDRLVTEAPLKDGELDKEAFKKLIETAVKEEATYLSQLTGGVQVIGMGQAASAVETDPAKIAEAEKEYDETFKEHMNVLADIFVGEATEENKGARKAFRKGRAA